MSRLMILNGGTGSCGKYEFYDAAGNLVEDEWMDVVKGGEYTLKLYTPPVNTGSLGFYAAGNDSVLESMDFVYHGYFEFACYGTNIDFKSVYWTVEGEDEKHYELPESAEVCYDGDQTVDGYGVNDYRVEKKSEAPETPDTGDKIGKTVAALMVAVSACAFVMWRMKRRA